MSNNTEKSFRNKWNNNPSLALEQTLDPRSEIFKWILSRNGFNSPEELAVFLSGKKQILDAGCGNGRVTSLLRKYSNPDTTSVTGVDLVAADVARENLMTLPGVQIFQADLSGDLSQFGLFDFIYCQEVLHHTPDPQKSFQNLVNILAPGGDIAIYVYRRKAPMREFADDWIREKIAGLDYEKAMVACRQITELGRSLSECKEKVRVPAVDVLEIKEGEYSFQRFLYHFFLKCFWNDEFSFEENSVINYDWYHPQNCSRHTLAEVKKWFEDAGLTITWEHDDFYGITISGKNGTHD